MEAALLKEDEGRGQGTMWALTNSAPVEYAKGAELARLDLATSRDLLQERGYELIDRFGHVHATKDRQELHVCLLADLATMDPSQFLVCLDEAIQQSLEHVLSQR